MASKIFKPRRGSQSTMTSAEKQSLLLESGEFFLEYPSGGVGTGASKVKIGDGVTTYSNLPYALGEVSDKANTLATARTIALSGGATGTATSFDGSANITIPVTSVSASILTGTASIATTGNAGSATKLATARTIGLSGGATGTATSFDGSADITIPVTSIDANLITGTINIANLPQGALERCVVVADDTARYALTTANVQLGDTVKVTATGFMYFVKDESNLANSNGYEVYTSGAATAVSWSGITDKPSTYPPSEHTHLYAGSATAGGAATTALACTGNAGSATKLATARTIGLSGGATGSATSFDGSANITIPVTALDASKLTGTASVSTTGNAATATKLATARKIAVTGAFAGTASFDGTADVSIALTSADFGDEG